MRPELTLIMGGHDHNVMRRGRVKRCLIVKGASNARTLAAQLAGGHTTLSCGRPLPPDPRRSPPSSRPSREEVLLAHVMKPLGQPSFRPASRSAAQVYDLTSLFTGPWIR